MPCRLPLIAWAAGPFVYVSAGSASFSAACSGRTTVCLLGAGCTYEKGRLLGPQGRWGSHPSTPAGAFAPNPTFCVVLCAAFGAHASGMPKRWQRAKEASLCMEVCNLAHSVSSDADAPRNGGMTTSGALDTGARCRRGRGNQRGSPAGYRGRSVLQKNSHRSSPVARAAGPLGFPPQHPGRGFRPEP